MRHTLITPANVRARKALTATILALLILLLPTLAAADQPATDIPPELAPALELLTAKSFKDKRAAVVEIAQSGHPAAIGLLQTLLDAKLYTRKADGRLVNIQKDGKAYHLSDPFTGDALETVKKKAIKKITINNPLRKLLRKHIATLSLEHADPDVRYNAVQELLRDTPDNLHDVLHPLTEKEQDPKVLALMNTGLLLAQLKDTDGAKQLMAIEGLSGNLNQTVRNTLTRLRDAEDTDPDVAAAARVALQSTEQKIAFYNKLETLFFGLSLGSVLVLAAIGLAITFGVMGVINMAHGELIMLGAYTTFIIQQLMPNTIALSVIVAIPAAFIVSGATGILIERSIIRFLYGRPLETLLATFGVSLILQQLVRSLISPQNVPVSNPDWMSGSLAINEVLSLTYNRLYIFLFCLIVFAALYILLRRTTLGLQVRAVSQNRAMARAMGVRSERVDAMTFGLGAGVAGIAGVALSQLTNVGPNLGQAYIIDSYMVVVFGGVGNLLGTLVAGLSLGVANKLIEPSAGAVLAKILVLVFIILFIQKRPRGLFPQKGRAAEH